MKIHETTIHLRRPFIILLSFRNADDKYWQSCCFGPIIILKLRLTQSWKFDPTLVMEMVNLDPLWVSIKCHLMDIYSPAAYAFAQYIHVELSGHSYNRLALERIHITQGVSLFRDISDQCLKCKIKRRRFLESSMGPVGDHLFHIAPPFYACQTDLFGPVAVYEPVTSKSLS